MIKNPSPTEPVDIERFEQITDGDSEFLRIVSEDYLAQADEVICAIQKAIEGRSMETIRQLAHKLRGSSSTCGIVAVLEPLNELEHLPGDSEFEAASDLNAQIVGGIEKARSFLSDYLAEGTAPGNS